MAKLPKQRFRPRRTGFPLSATQGVLLLIGMASVGALSAWIGYETGLRDSSTQGSRLLSSLHSMFATERVVLDGEKQAVGEHLNALARKLGEMRAEVMRLEAMGQRLVVKRGLDPEEFDFSLPPALGGPGSESEWTTQAPDLMADFDQLSQRIEDRSHKLALLEGLLLSHEIREQTQPSGSPVAAGWISSRYGWRTDPFNGTRSHHRGVDFAGKSGSDIIAVADGVVTLAGMRSGFGKTIEIKHGNGYLTRYAHNHSLKVKKGDIVHQGQVIAAMGHSGRATGTHLHFEVIRDGKNIDPLRFVDAPQGKKKAG